MDAATITMEPEEALEKLQALDEERHADAQEFNRACMEAYEELAEGRKLLHLSKSIQRGGLLPDGRPRLAIAAADRREVYFEWGPNNPVAYYVDSPNRMNRDRYPRLIRYVQMGQVHRDHHPPREGDKHVWGKTRTGYAMVPEIPADVRPPTGQKRDWYIIWEVDAWAASSRLAPAPGDPILLRHIRGELYAVLAEWDLTEVERAIMEELARPAANR